MQPYTFVMRPVGNNQINPYFNPPMADPANPLMSYQVSLQFRQCATLTMNPSFNPQMMHPMNTCPYPSGNPQINPSMNPRMISNVNPQVMGPNSPRPPVNPQLMGPGSIPPVNQQMIQMQNPSVVHSQHISSMSQFQVPSLNCPSVMSVRSPNLPPVNLSQPIPSLNPQMMPPMNCQSFQPVNSQNNYPPMNHIPPTNARTIPQLMSQPVNPPNYPQNVQSVNYQNMPIINPQTVMSVREQAPLSSSETATPIGGQTFPPSSNSQNFHLSPDSPSFYPLASSQTFHLSADSSSFCLSADSPSFHLSADSPSFYPVANPQNFSSSADPQNIPSSTNPQNFSSAADPENIPSSDNPQTVPSSVNAQEKPNAESSAKSKVKKVRAKSRPKKKTGASNEETSEEKKVKRSKKGASILWEDPTYKKSKADSGKCNGNNESNSVPQENGLNKPPQNMQWKDVKLNITKEKKKKKEKKEKKEKEKKKEKKEKKVETSKPDKEASSNNSKSNTPLITVKAKGDKPLDEKKMEYFKTLKPMRMVSRKEQGKKRLSENDKTKAKILKIFALMQKLKGVSKKLWQNVAANGEFKDNPAVPEEVTKFLILSQKFMGEVECIVKLTKKEEPSPNETPPKDAKTKPKELGEDSSKEKAVTKQPTQKKRKTVPFTLKLLLKKLDVLDALGLCFVNINGIFIKRYCSVIVKLRKSLNALLDKSKTSLKKKRLKIPRPPCLPQWGAIMLTCYGGTTYSKALHLAMTNIKFKSLGIQCIKKRRSVTGGLILEVFADEDYEKKTDQLAEKLQEIYASLEVRVSRPQKYGELVITRLDSTATVEQICEQLAKLGNCSADVFKTGSMGKTCIWVRCPLNIAIQLDQKTIEINSTVSRINLKAKKCVRCYKCFNMGHVKDICPSLIDHNNMCFKCGLSDHEARTCHNAPRCLACHDNSLPACHRLGGEKCPSAIPKFVKRPANNGTKKNENSKKKGKGLKGKSVNKKKSVTPTISNIKPPAPNQARSRN